MTRRTIQQRLKARGLTQVSVARAAGVSPSLVAHLLRGRTKSARVWALIRQMVA